MIVAESPWDGAMVGLSALGESPEEVCKLAGLLLGALSLFGRRSRLHWAKRSS